MPRPTEPVKRVCYADDLTVWTTGVNIPDLGDSINSYLEDITAYLKVPLVQCPKILGVYPDISLSFNKHSGYVAERVSSRNHILKALAGTPWGQQKEILLMTYKPVGRSIINYGAPVWITNLRDINYRHIQFTQNEALRIATGCHKMSSVDHMQKLKC